MEIKSLVSNEVSKPSVFDSKAFDPDKRNDVNRKPEIKEISVYDPDKRSYSDEKSELTSAKTEFSLGKPMDGCEKTDTNDIYCTSYTDRINKTPLNSENGTWAGDRGESKYIPSGNTPESKLAKDKLAEYGLDGIEYKDGLPDFSKCSEASVQIDGMSSKRPLNFSKADIKTAEMWNEIKKDGRNDWTDKAVEKYRQEKHLIWHENADKKTMHLVSGDIHPDGEGRGIFTHSGGVAECIAQEKMYSGGMFDE